MNDTMVLVNYSQIIKQVDRQAKHTKRSSRVIDRRYEKSPKEATRTKAGGLRCEPRPIRL